MTQNPIELFQNLFDEELAQSNLKVPSACCFSTIGADGYPNSRFVALKEVNNNGFVVTGPISTRKKEVNNNGFVVTGPISTRKGDEARENSKVSITLWWSVTETQVRIQGDASLITPEQADNFFAERPRESQITSHASNQGETIEDPDVLQEVLKNVEKEFEGRDIPRPENWGGFCVKPIRIEFLFFSYDRLHRRTLYTKTQDGWDITCLQP